MENERKKNKIVLLCFYVFGFILDFDIYGSKCINIISYVL